MAVTYDLIIIGDTSAEDFVARVYDDALPPPAFEPSNKAQAADENERLGFSLTLLEGRDGYFQDEDWEIEPARYLDVEFRVDKERRPGDRARQRPPVRRPRARDGRRGHGLDQQQLHPAARAQGRRRPARPEQLLGRLTKRP